jgi:hypothetical protein
MNGHTLGSESSFVSRRNSDMQKKTKHPFANQEG